MSSWRRSGVAVTGAAAGAPTAGSTGQPAGAGAPTAGGHRGRLLPPRRRARARPLSIASGVTSLVTAVGGGCPAPFPRRPRRCPSCTCSFRPFPPRERTLGAELAQAAGSWFTTSRVGSQASAIAGGAPARGPAAAVPPQPQHARAPAAEAAVAPARRQAEQHGLTSPDASPEPSDAPREPLLEWLMDTHLYSIGAYFSDQHPELVDEVIRESELIERRGLAQHAADEQITLESAFQTLITGLAVRYYKAVTG